MLGHKWEDNTEMDGGEINCVLDSSEGFMVEVQDK
jgi:hypothetical protein